MKPLSKVPKLIHYISLPLLIEQVASTTRAATCQILVLPQETSTIAGDHLQKLALTIRAGACRPLLLIAPLHQLGLTHHRHNVILCDLILATTKSTEFKDTLPSAALHSVWYQFSPLITPVLKHQPFHGNQELISLPTLPQHQHGFWTTVLLTTSLST